MWAHSTVVFPIHRDRKLRSDFDRMVDLERVASSTKIELYRHTNPFLP